MENTIPAYLEAPGSQFGSPHWFQHYKDRRSNLRLPPVKFRESFEKILADREFLTWQVHRLNTW